MDDARRRRLISRSGAASRAPPCPAVRFRLPRSTCLSILATRPPSSHAIPPQRCRPSTMRLPLQQVLRTCHKKLRFGPSTDGSRIRTAGTVVLPLKMRSLCPLVWYSLPLRHPLSKQPRLGIRGVPAAVCKLRGRHVIAMWRDLLSILRVQLRRRPWGLVAAPPTEVPLTLCGALWWDPAHCA